MVWTPIDVNAQLFTNMQDVSRDVLSGSRKDVVKDLAGSTYSRPKLTQFATGYGVGGGGCRGNYYWRYKNRLYSVFAQTLWETDKNGNVKKITSSEGLFEINQRTVIFTEAVQPTRKLFMANGGKIIEFDGTTASYLTDVDAPTKVTHVGILDTYLLANNLLQPERMEYSEVGTPGSWVGEFISAEGNPDLLQAIHVAFREIGLFGEAVLENWYNDGTSPFSRIEGAMVEAGTLSPYTIKKINDGYYLLDQFKRAINIVGRQVNLISPPVDNIFGGKTNIDYAIGDYIGLEGLFLYLLRIEDQVLVYDTVLKEWLSEWGLYNTSTGEYDPYPGIHFVNIPNWGMTLCGDYQEGRILRLITGIQQTVGGGGSGFSDSVRAEWRTGLITHGTGKEKRANGIRLRMARGLGDPNQVEPIMYIRWRDNGSKVWSNYRQIDLGFSGDDEIYREIYQLGSYRSREYEFSCSEPHVIAISAVEEDIEELLY